MLKSGCAKTEEKAPTTLVLISSLNSELPSQMAEGRKAVTDKS